MQANEENLQHIMQDLLLNQALTKRDIARTVKLSLYKINRILHETQNVYFIKNDQEDRLIDLYRRLKQYEHKIDEYIVEIDKSKKDKDQDKDSKR